jgi:hypothetical protein
MKEESKRKRSRRGAPLLRARRRVFALSAPSPFHDPVLRSYTPLFRASNPGLSVDGRGHRAAVPKGVEGRRILSYLTCYQGMMLF